MAKYYEHILSTLFSVNYTIRTSDFQSMQWSISINMGSLSFLWMKIAEFSKEDIEIMKKGKHTVCSNMVLT